ncbi:hydrolase [Lithospermum erythrorhizon]|uniref:Hydrolase n=1 Tax=Lithospermum erythrorhizon TaxID=34254 RepID=A0AAV3Q279_LITER
MIRLVVGVITGAIGLAYLALKPPSPKICGSPGGPPVISPRVKLRDGRHLAYREWGVGKDKANYKIIVVHGFRGSKDHGLPIAKELVDELGLYLLSFDRAGYGESDPNSKRSVKSESFDIQELADKLEIGDKFYVIGTSMGGYSIWSCLYYIPHRLAGAALVVPFVHFWWPSFPAEILNKSFNKMLPQLRLTLRVARYAPSLLYLLMSQRVFPYLSMVWGNFPFHTKKDLEIIKQKSKDESVVQDQICEQGIHESFCRDIMVGFSKWEFDPTEVSNPFPNNDGSVHLWQGYEDKMIPFEMNRYISLKLPWIKYHELPDHGHEISPSVWVDILKELVKK